MNTAKDIARLLSERVNELAFYLYPNGRQTNSEFLIGSIEGEAGQSMKICLEGNKKGLWADFATGHGGDLIDLWMAKRKISCAEALKEAKQWLGITDPEFIASKPKKLHKPDNNLAELSIKSPVAQYLMGERNVSFDTLLKFKISEKNNYIVFPFYREQELLMTKSLHITRENEKKKIFVDANCEPCLFGWQALPDNLREITLTEGEIDAMSLWEYGIPALSLPFGGGSGDKHRWIDTEFDRLAVFDKIYLCFDNDEVGQQTLAAVIDRLGRHRCYVVTLPAKDANACLQQGISQEIISECFVSAKTQDPDELKSARSYLDQVMNLFYPNSPEINGYFPAWKKCKNHVAFRPHELSVWTGINGHGKSQFIGHLLLQCMMQGAKVCIASLEMKPERLLMRLTRQMAAVALPDEKLIKKIQDWFAEKLWLFDLVGTAKTDRLLEVFLYARQRYGVDVFLLDSMLKCGIADDDYNSQKAFIENLCDFKNEHPCHVHVVVHPRKGADEKDIPGKLDIKGTGSISDLADNCFSVWRNKEKNNPNDADCIWMCNKQRNGEWEGKFSLWFDPESFQYLESFGSKPINLLEGADLGAEMPMHATAHSVF